MRQILLTTLSAALVLGFGLMSGGLLRAQEVQPAAEGAVDIPVEEWSRMAMGKTLVYRIDGQLWAYEHYYSGTNRVALQLYDGSCMQGTWDYTAPFYCFHWDVEGTACFRHARRGNDILILEATRGDRVPLIQKMTDVTDMALTCNAPIS